MQFKERCTLVEDSTKLAWSFGKVDKECKKHKRTKNIPRKQLKLLLAMTKLRKMTLNQINLNIKAQFRSSHEQVYAGVLQYSCSSLTNNILKIPMKEFTCSIIVALSYPLSFLCMTCLRDLFLKIWFSRKYPFLVELPNLSYN